MRLGPFRKLLIFIFTLIFLAAELSAMALYALGMSSETDMIYDAARAVDLARLTDGAGDTESLEGAFDVLKEAVGSDTLGSIETADELIAALPETRAFRDYFGSLVSSLLTGGVRIDLNAAKDAAADAIEELTGIDAENSAELRNFAAEIIERHAYEFFERMLDSAGLSYLADGLRVDGDCVELVNALLNERTRRLSVVLCAGIALLLLWLCKGLRHWLAGFGAWIGCIGTASAVSGLIFCAGGYFGDYITELVSASPYFLLAPFVTALRDSLFTIGQRVLYPGIAAVFIYLLIFRRSNDE